MISAILFIDISPIFGVAFFLIFAVVAFIAYKMLKKTVKMAVRMTIVVAILLIALIGSVALLLFSGSSRNSSTKPATTNQKTR